MGNPFQTRAQWQGQRQPKTSHHVESGDADVVDEEAKMRDAVWGIDDADGDAPNSDASPPRSKQNVALKLIPLFPKL